MTLTTATILGLAGGIVLGLIVVPWAAKKTTHCPTCKQPIRSWLDEQIIFDNRMDVMRMVPLLNRICDATGHDDYEAAVDAILSERD